MASDEIGISTYSSPSYAHKNVHVYNMGISKIRELCEGRSFNGYGKYYHGVCIDKNFKIEKRKLIKAKKQNKKENPKIVVWPYSNQADVIPVFYEEVPDPLPTCSVSGYPVSIQFNDYYFKNISLISFKLYDGDNNEVTQTRVLTRSSDPHSKFTKFQFALFPLQRLDFDSYYEAVVEYRADGEKEIKRWTFKTKKLDYPSYKMTHTNQTFKIKSNQPYAIYIPPRNCNDNSKSYNFSFPSSVKILKHKFIDQNTIYFKIKGGLSKVVKVKLANGLKFKLRISSGDSADY